MNLRPYIEKFSRRYSEVEAALSDPKVLGNTARLQELSREYARLKELNVAGGRYLKVVDDLAQHAALLKTEPAGSEMAQLARDEIGKSAAWPRGSMFRMNRYRPACIAVHSSSGGVPQR